MIEPVGHHVLVKPDKVEEQSKGGIIYATEAKDREQNAMQRGEVIAIGPQAWLAFDDGTPWAKVGDRVIYKRYSGILVDDEPGDDYRIINDEDIVAVVKD